MRWVLVSFWEHFPAMAHGGGWSLHRAQSHWAEEAEITEFEHVEAARICTSGSWGRAEE